MSERPVTLVEPEEQLATADIEELELALAAEDATHGLPPSGPEPNLLHIGWIGRLFRSRLYPGVFQFAGLIVFGAVDAGHAVRPHRGSRQLRLDRRLDPVVAAAAALLLPLLALLVHGVPVPGGRRPGSSASPASTARRRASSRGTASGSSTLTFLFITWADHVFGIVESPRGTGYLLLAMLGGAIVMSLFFERRAFCSHLCFLGGLSGNYSDDAPVAFRANQENCKKVGCKDLWCANGSARAAACPCTRRRGPWTPTATATCAATA